MARHSPSDADSGDPIIDLVSAQQNDEPSPLDDGNWVLRNKRALLDAVLLSKKTTVYLPVDFPRIMVEVPDPDRPGQTKREPLSVRVRGPRDDEREEIERASRKPVRRRHGQVPEMVLNESLFQRNLVYEMTHPDDRARLWDDPDMQQACDVASGPDLIGEILLAGEIVRLAGAIVDLSGLTEDVEATSKSLVGSRR